MSKFRPPSAVICRPPPFLCPPTLAYLLFSLAVLIQSPPRPLLSTPDMCSACGVLRAQSRRSVAPCPCHLSHSSSTPPPPPSLIHLAPSLPRSRTRASYQIASQTASLLAHRQNSSGPTPGVVCTQLVHRLHSPPPCTRRNSILGQTTASVVCSSGKLPCADVRRAIPAGVTFPSR
ncbi:hypothetical protein PHLGIDRAFT_423631 [Phlebiopsis gigantea 11061_1 CR5-6]|uniref:Uncharacterized protein n=1 Tax=Phlebiopsis gigantea (strain 11061_1 CR5-6) TaxID=745531 RepID=A0A0C3NQB4_PHLG1|nr:hypothetical protein PHLGIDRAFT_423631 [Phlebiopsis gigantea 11061_1 CR5-6]